ncbi:efflux RND transporter periplasmic adaptor subunit [Gluconacetobacter takamatsuzukensis]|uniref:Efflux RND transporter periplasmic adaptor subunit n=1 Tax=Gluconacetobacter takamatsuzukensis TaxID=1286190 RepID=A0A7W4KFW8_9PROT|nr:efflux RND transporter periplasmic adaptor subunit [Gluconacetobacter takamatsuzukensis]MBB2206177.1 efflux RND transporter periplasmic adaptor subunit [Gluconacetobacter takamatsuzukensis]
MHQTAPATYPQFFFRSSGRALRPVAAGLAVCAILFGGLACARADTAMVRDDHGRLTVAPDSPLAARLSVTSVTLASPSRTIPVPGEIRAEPSQSLSVMTPVAGAIVSLPVSAGDHVTRNQVVAELASGDMALATTDATKARAGLDYARRALARAQGVASAGGAATRDVESARNAWLQAQAEDDRATARLAALRAQPGQGGVIRLTAPIDGTVSAVNTAAGAFVTDPTAPLMTIVGTGQVWAVAAVPENLADTVHVGQQADITVAARPGLTAHGTIAAIEPALQADTRTLQARVVLANDDAMLKPGMFATVTILTPQPPRIMVPQSALLMNNDTVTVFVETAPHTYRRREIEIIYDDGDLCEVISGLSAGDRVVTQGAVLLNDD